MSRLEFTILAHAIGLALLWGYALWLLLAIRAERRRAGRAGQRG